jgi:Carboxypeptidase regulatory-like domain
MIGAFIRSNTIHAGAMARSGFVLLGFSLVLSMFLSSAAYAADGGKVMGTVKDQTGAVLPNAEVDLTSKSTGVAQNTKSDSAGAYTFPLVPVGTYTLTVHAAGFNPVEHEGLVVNIHSVVEQDLVLAVGDQTQTVTVNDSETQVETAETELGETLGSEKITSVPLNGRSYTDLLSVQSGVTPISTSASQSGSSGGSFATATAPSGGLDPGQFSISGQRESANGFVMNGASVVEGIASAAAVIPNLDSIAEFRILTTNSDAEFGNYSGGLVNVVTKSGTNQLHGSVFEFLRNTVLDAKGYFDSERPTYIQNQFGGTLGGPVRHDKVFFFTDYQGNRTVQGIETAQIPVPSTQDRSGNLSDVTSFNGTVSDAYFASQLIQRLGHPVAVGDPYYTSGCTSPTQCVFPNGVIPRAPGQRPRNTFCNTFHNPLA